MVTAWIREVQAARAEAEAQLRTLGQARPRMLDRQELAEMTRAIGDMVRVLTDADPARKARIYAGLGLRLTYHPDKKKVLVGQASAQDIGERYVSEGGLEPPCPFGALAPQASASAYSATRTWPGTGTPAPGCLTIANLTPPGEGDHHSTPPADPPTWADATITR